MHAFKTSTLLILNLPATLAHEKFYNIASYESRMAALRAGEFVPPADDGYDPEADMRALRKPDPYKNKGVRYTGEKLKKKVGKTGAK